MCHACVIESVRERMLSRRSLFKGALSAGAVATAGAVGVSSATPAFAATPSEVTDMTHALENAFPTYFGAPGFDMEQGFNFAEHGFNLFNMSINEHTGTHIDAPLHFSADGNAVDEIPVSDLVAPLAVIDIRSQAAENADYELTPDDLKVWKSKHGDFPEKCCIAMLSGWGDKTATDEYRNVGDDDKMHFPGFHIEATQMMLEETSAVAMAVDTLSLDHGPSADFKTHNAWLPTNRFGIENIANLDQVPENGATLVIGAPKHKGGSGGPARIVALV